MYVWEGTCCTIAYLHLLTTFVLVYGYQPVGHASRRGTLKAGMTTTIGFWPGLVSGLLQSWFQLSGIIRSWSASSPPLWRPYAKAACSRRVRKRAVRGSSQGSTMANGSLFGAPHLERALHVATCSMFILGKWINKYPQLHRKPHRFQHLLML